MTAASNYLETAWLNHWLNQSAFSVPANLYVALFTSNPADDGSGTEVSGGSYARVNHNSWNAASARATSNNGGITFPTATGSWGTVTHFGIFDASSVGNLLFYGALNTSRTVTTGKTFSILDTQLDISVDAGGMTTYLANAMLDHTLKVAAYTQPTIHVGLYTTATSDAGAGTEVSGGSYARVAVSGWTVSGGAAENTSAINFPTSTGSWGTVSHMAILDASSAGNMLHHGAVDSSQAVGSGEDVQVAAGAYDLTID